MRNFVSLKDFTEEEILYLVREAIAYKNKEKALPDLSGITIANLFFEPSTRTNASFYQAELQTNMKILNIDMSNLSTIKGETLVDTIQVFESIELDGLVIRHNKEFYYKELIDHFFMGFINGGDGKNEHPSQALLDLVTIYENKEELEGLEVLIIGDIKHSRVARSNVDILQRLGMNVKLACPEECVDKSFAESMYVKRVDDVIDKTDVVMLLRVQKERHETAMSEMDYLMEYGLNEERYEKLKDDAIIMHPGPYNQGVEITDKVAHSEKSKIWEQVTNGVYARIAILNYVFGSEK